MTSTHRGPPRSRGSRAMPISHSQAAEPASRTLSQARRTDTASGSSRRLGVPAHRLRRRAAGRAAARAAGRAAARAGKVRNGRVPAAPLDLARARRFRTGSNRARQGGSGLERRRSDVRIERGAAHMSTAKTCRSAQAGSTTAATHRAFTYMQQNAARPTRSHALVRGGLKRMTIVAIRFPETSTSRAEGGAGQRGSVARGAAQRCVSRMRHGHRHQPARSDPGGA